MQNETQNQNIDSQEAKVEEAPVQTEMPQEQNIGVNADPYRGPDVEEPADIIDPKVTMNPEDISGPQTDQEQQGFDEATSDFWDPPESPENLSDSLLGDVFDWDSSSWGADDTWGGCGTFPSEDPFSWESGGSDVPDPTATIGIIADPVPTDQVEPSDSEAATPLSPEAVSMPIDKIVDPAGQVEPTPGGYDESGIAGGLDLDGNGKFDQTENNPDIMSNNGEEQVYTYDENAYEDAEDALEDLQDALQDGDEEDLYEAIEYLQDYLGGFGKGDEEEDQDGTKTQDNQIPSDSEDNSDGGAGTIWDADGNDILDWEEWDSDGDGIKNANEDSDGDGVADWVDFDSDNDGIDDWKVLDSDGDGMTDGDASLDVTDWW